MLGLHSVAANIAVSDLGKAREFYSNKLGMKAIDEMEGEVVFKAPDDTDLHVYQKSDVSPSGNTVATFEVDDVQQTMRALEDSGISFEEYDMPEAESEGPVVTIGKHKAAWFKDPDGNILCVHAKA